MCILNRLTKVQHQNTTNQTVIWIFIRYPTNLLIRYVSNLKNHDTFPNEPTIKTFLETTSGSKLRKCYNNIIIKEKLETWININDIHEVIMFVVSKHRTHTWRWLWLVWVSINCTYLCVGWWLRSNVRLNCWQNLG